jgi:hypothetical protein
MTPVNDDELNSMDPFLQVIFERGAFPYPTTKREENPPRRCESSNGHTVSDNVIDGVECVKAINEDDKYAGGSYVLYGKKFRDSHIFLISWRAMPGRILYAHGQTCCGIKVLVGILTKPSIMPSNGICQMQIVK